MTQSNNAISDTEISRPCPGYLMAPFGWAAESLAGLLEADRSLYAALFSASCSRMHLIALALTHAPPEADAAFARLIVHGAPQAILDTVLGRWPAGIKRALAHLPHGVVPQTSYRQLIELLEQPDTAKLLHHRSRIEADFLAMLYALPTELRRVFAAAIEENFIEPGGIAEGLRILAARGAAASFEALVADLAAIRQPAQLIARLLKLISRLPLPELMPPAHIGGAHRLDHDVHIRQLAKRWKNCLASCYLDAVNDGRSVVYLWPHGEAPAVCVVSRYGRLGWGLEAAYGPENANLPPGRLQEIHSAFAAAGIPEHSAIGGLYHARLIHGRGGERRRRRQRDEQAMQDEIEEIFDELDEETENAVEILEAA